MKKNMSSLLLTGLWMLYACQSKPVEQAQLITADSIPKDTIPTKQSSLADHYEEFITDAGIAMRKVQQKDLALKYKGNFLDAYSWKDANGLNT
ncbi:MAG: hypothetical protein ACOYXT_14705, partial [Bacteroidota bacterium]